MQAEGLVRESKGQQGSLQGAAQKYLVVANAVVYGENTNLNHLDTQLP